MADNRRQYTVKVNDRELTMLLDREDAERYGDRATPVKKAAPNTKGDDAA